MFVVIKWAMNHSDVPMMHFRSAYFVSTFDQYVSFNLNMFRLAFQSSNITPFVPYIYVLLFFRDKVQIICIIDSG